MAKRTAKQAHALEPATENPRQRAKCLALLGTLMAYLDDELSPARARELERHLASCTCCGTMADNLRTAIALCRAEGARRLPRDVSARARARAAAISKAIREKS